MKFYANKENGQLIATLGEELDCKGFTQINANSTDAAQEKHVPVVNVIANHVVTVDVGSVPHPMTEAHLISYVILETTHGFQIKKLAHTDAPKAVFALAEGEKPVAAYEYCNLHGLWVAKI